MLTDRTLCVIIDVSSKLPANRLKSQQCLKNEQLSLSVTHIICIYDKTSPFRAQKQQNTDCQRS